jgi:HEAT repeat protein
MIVAKLQSDDRCVQLAAACALGAIGASAKDALPLLNDMLGSDDEYARFVVADSILRIDSASEKAISVIFNLLNNETSPHKLFAAASLGERGKEYAVPDLKQLLNDEDAGVRSESSLAIWKITGDSADALTVGRKLLDDPDWLVRQIGMEHFEELAADVC